MDPQISERLRLLPSVEELAESLGGNSHALAVRAARASVGSLRERILAGEDPDVSAESVRRDATRRMQDEGRGSLVQVINATGVILHTNLGRAPLADEAQDAVAKAAGGYSNLELDLETGSRGSRHDHIQDLVTELTGAPAAIAVNNNAAAVLLALTAHAAGREVLVSRGELVEIGGSFRIPEILKQSGAKLVEVGTTNRTRIGDYEEAIGDATSAILRVHQANFRMVGFTSSPADNELAELARRKGIRFIHDLGSGAVEAIADEPSIHGAVSAGADLVTFSADKLLGGPQAGIIAGSAEAVEACRNNPLARVLRLDKLQLAALAATLRLHLDGRSDEIPALQMLGASDDELQGRAQALAGAIGSAARVEQGASMAGGGSLPGLELPGSVCVLDPGGAGAEALAERLRQGEPPVIARIANGEVILDPRTIAEGEVAICAEQTRRALGEP